MSTEENKALLRRYIEESNKRNEAGIEELVAPDYVMHVPLPPGISPDRAGWSRMRNTLLAAFPDMHMTVENLIAEGDKVAYRCTLRGTHQGDFMGMPPTGKQVSYTGIEIERIEDNRFVEVWGSADLLGLMQQLGAIPQMAQGRA